ncbi:MAG TPA: hypothetical protein VGN51_13850 [Acidimicrobiia bacterium]
MRFVDDHQVPRFSAQEIAIRSSEVDAHHQAVAADLDRLRRYLETFAELLVQLVAPLLAETRGRQHEDAASETTQHQLLEDQAGLDGLAETHLVGQDRSAAHLSEHL